LDFEKYVADLDLSPDLSQVFSSSVATAAVIFPVLEFSIAILLALKLSKAVLVALIGRVSVDFKSMPEGLFNLRRLST
jgi:hypothetical protein